MKISIITATYNSAAHIAGCLASVNNQTYKNIEHIIVDGDSTDNTLKIIKSTPNRVAKIISEPDNGIYDAMNKGVRLATGEIIGILNSDDEYLNNEAIQKIIEIFENKKVDSVYTDLYIVDNKNPNKIIRNCTYQEYRNGLFLKGWHPPHPTFFVKRNVYEKYGLFDLSFNIAADYEFMLRVLEKHSIEAAYLPIHTIKMRNGGVSTSSFKNIILSQKECLVAFKKNKLSLNFIKYFAGRYNQKLKQYSLKSLFADIISKK